MSEDIFCPSCGGPLVVVITLKDKESEKSLKDLIDIDDAIDEINKNRDDRPSPYDPPRPSPRKFPKDTWIGKKNGEPRYKQYMSEGLSGDEKKAMGTLLSGAKESKLVGQNMKAGVVYNNKKTSSSSGGTEYSQVQIVACKACQTAYIRTVEEEGKQAFEEIGELSTKILAGISAIELKEDGEVEAGQ